MHVRNILCPVDFSEASDDAVRYAAELAEQLQAKLFLLHSFQLPVYAAQVGAPLAPTDLIEGLPQQLQQQLDELRDRIATPGLQIEGEVVEGVPYVKILEQAEAVDADLIVMGTHGRTGLAHLLIGSVAERVVRLSERPVLTVPGHHKKAGK